VVDVTASRLERLLGPPRTADGLTGGAVLSLSQEFPGNPLTAEARVLANRFLATTREIGDCRAPQVRLAWHHLLMTVANARSRSGTLRLGGGSVYLDPTPEEAAASFCLPSAEADGHSLQLSSDDPLSWRRLTEQVPGLTVPTASAVLAAIWPTSHAALDNIAMGSLVGLQAIDAEGRPAAGVTLEELNNVWRDSVAGVKSWADYDWFIGTLRATASRPDMADRGVRIADVEQALTLIGGRAAGYSAAQWGPWAARLHELVRLAEESWSA
jgi:hypothetical protein